MYFKLLFIIMLSLASCNAEDRKADENTCIVLDEHKKLITDSTETEFYPSGKIHSIKKYNRDKSGYQSIAYYESGSIACIMNSLHKKTNGICLDFYENGDTMNIAVYNMGKLIDLNSWDQKGNHCIINGTGKMELFFPDGKIKGTGEYKDLKFHGRWTIFYPNGQIQKELFFDQGKSVGIWKSWNRDGKLTDSTQY